VQEVFDKYDDNVFRAANSLGAGLAYKGETCGSLLGGYLMLGLKFGLGREEIDSPEKLHTSYPASQEFYDWFHHELGSANCRDIRATLEKGLDFDQLDPQQREKAIFDELHRRCDQITGKVAARIVEILWDAIEAEKE